jgi:hypothetical protein
MSTVICWFVPHVRVEVLEVFCKIQSTPEQWGLPKAFTLWSLVTFLVCSGCADEFLFVSDDWLLRGAADAVDSTTTTSGITG